MSRAPHLTIEHIAKSFGPSPVLDGISLEVAAGEFLALIGPSGWSAPIPAASSWRGVTSP
jgi:ABC-type Fe3+/spermidine/putrescine transport system ATPase subunit